MDLEHERTCNLFQLWLDFEETESENFSQSWWYCPYCGGKLYELEEKEKEVKK